MSIALFLALSLVSARPTISVVSGPTATASIQAAIDNCPVTGCRIELPSAKYQLDNQIWILDKDSVEIVGTNAASRSVVTWTPSKLANVANPLSAINVPAAVAAIFTLRPPAGSGRPDTLPAGWLMWPNIGSAQQKVSNGPVGSAADYSNPYSNNGFQHNGMFLVKNSRFVEFRHLSLDGGKPAHFLNRGIWTEKYSVLAGSVGVNFLQSLHGTVADCELAHFWSAIYLNDRNPACLTRENPNDIVVGPSKYLQACGRMGGHLVEQNEIHHSWWAAFSETAWDLGSVFRENLAWELKNTSVVYSDTLVTNLDDEMANNMGGFLFEKDVVYPAHVVSNNTMREVLAPYAWGGFRASAHGVWSQNIIGAIPQKYGPFRPFMDYRQQLTNDKAHSRSNTFALDPRLTSTGLLGASDFFDSTFVIGPNGLDTNKTTGQVDTIWFTAAKGWMATPEAPVDSVYTNILGALPLHYNAPYRGDTVHFTATDRNGIRHSLSGWNPGVWDTVGFLRTTMDYRLLPVGLDSSLWKNQYVLFSKYMTDSDANRTAYFQPDAPSEITRRAYSPNGESRGAFGPDGAIGSQNVGRARVAGAPWFDATAKKLHLPVRLGTKGVPTGSVSRFSVLAGCVSKLRIDESSTGGTLNPESISDFPTPEPIGPNATEIVIPFAGTDTLVQFDLWLGAHVDDRIFPTTPVVWVWANGMKSDTSLLPHTSALTNRAPANRILHTGTDAKGWYIDLEKTPNGARLVSLDGRSVPLVAQLRTAATRLRPARELDGIWLLRVPGIESQIHLIR